MTTQRMLRTNCHAIDATTDAAVAAGGSANPGPKQNYRLINMPQEA